MPISNKKDISDAKIALVCPGIGKQNRGMESFFENLFIRLKDKTQVKLIKGGGKSYEDEIKLPNISRDSWLVGGLGESATWGRKYLVEEITFFISLAIHLLYRDYDIIELGDPDLARYILNFKNIFHKNFKIVFMNGFPLPPEFYKDRFDLVQQVSKFNYEEGVKYSVGEEKMALIPHPVDTDNFKPIERNEKLLLKRKYGIPEDKFVILSAGSIDSSFKRMDYLIKETSEFKDDIYLLIAGQENQESKPIKELGPTIFKDNIKFITAKKEEMPFIYNLADLFVLCSLREGFGIVFIEAMASGLPVIAHRHPTMEWILGDCARIIDLSRENSLSSAISGIIADKNAIKNIGDSARKRAVEKFSWDNLMPQYLTMFRNLL